MRQVTGLTSTYSSDEFGICSALYELGGMVVMHDASGCNSTYTTHDEPRWYDMDSMIFISAISEMEAIMGDDDKFIEDLVETAEELQPKFIALVGAPIPYMIGTDLEAIAAIVSERVQIPCFAFAANGMHDYTRGVSMALERIVREYATEAVYSGRQKGSLETENHAGKLDRTETNIYPGKSETGTPVFRDEQQRVQSSPASNREDVRKQCMAAPITVNILGATPLDFSLNGSVDSIQKWISNQKMRMGSCLSIGCTLDNIREMGNADVNLVISAGGLAAAEILRERFGTPYVVGVPFGEKFSEYLAEIVREAASSQKNRISYMLKISCKNRAMSQSDKKAEIYSCDVGGNKTQLKPADAIGNSNVSSNSDVAGESGKRMRCVIIGESVFSASLAAAIEMERRVNVKVLCPLENGADLLRPGDLATPEEDDLIREIKSADAVIADPLYQSLARAKQFYPLPHEAFSGRIYDSVNPNLIAVPLK
ncbi:MAG: oxidoreductase [Clostridiales bacterium]|nr:oxidoreductase [Clostridiales bacterium]